MSYIKKLTAAVVATALASTLAGCTPTIGSSSKIALTIDGTDIPAGVFIYYTMQGYNEASSVLQSQTGETPQLKDVRNASIDSVDSTDWIQDKATEYCLEYAGICHEFDAVNCTLSAEDLDEASQMAEYYYAQDSRLPENGVSLDTLKAIAEMTYKEQALFDYYYGFEGEKGCSEDELKDYFDDNYARVKYVSISLTDDDGEKVAPDKERELRNMAQKYADQVNKKSGEEARLHEMDVIQDSYDEYIAAHTTVVTEEGETTTTTTTTTAAPDETETTTTTSPYYNERLMQKQTTTEATDSTEDSSETEAAEEETDTAKNSRLFNEYLFNTIEQGKAEVYEYSDEMIYVVMRGDLRERMTEDDYWSENYISSLQSMKYYDEFNEMMDEKAQVQTVEKNKTAYRRYSPFKLQLEYTN